MAGIISGNTPASSRVIIVDESDWSVESNTIESGDYSVGSLTENNKLVLSRNAEGEVVAYGDITPIISTPGQGEQDLSDWLVHPVDQDNIQVSSGSIVLNGVDRDEDVAFYNEFPDWIGTFEINVDVKIKAGTQSGGQFCYFGMSDYAQFNYSGAGKGIHNLIQRASVGGQRELRIYNRSDIDYYDNDITEGTWYYMRIGRTRVAWFYEIYSNPERTILLASRDVSNAYIRQPFRGYFMSNNFTGGTDQDIFAEIANLVWVSRQTFTEGWNPNNSFIHDATDETGDSKYVDFQSSSGNRGDIARYIYTGTTGAVVEAAYIANYHLDTRKKFYAEATFVQQGDADITESRIGICSEEHSYVNPDRHLGISGQESWCVQQNGYARNGVPGDNITGYLPTFADGDIVMMALDLTDLATNGGKIWFGRNGVWGTAPGGVGNPATGVNPSVGIIDDGHGVNFFPCASLAGENNRVMIKADPDRWTYSAPSGYDAFRWLGDHTAQ